MKARAGISDARATVRMAGAIAAAWLCAGCGCLMFSAGIPNHWEIRNGNLEASGWRGLDGIVRYDHLRIGTQEDPWDGRWRFCVVLPNRGVVQSTDFTREKIEAICPSNGVRIETRAGWPAGTKVYSTPDYRFVFAETGALLSFGAGLQYEGKSQATLGNASGTAFHRVSWTERQLHSLFGTNFTVISARSML